MCIANKDIVLSNGPKITKLRHWCPGLRWKVHCFFFVFLVIDCEADADLGRNKPREFQLVLQFGEPAKFTTKHTLRPLAVFGIVQFCNFWLSVPTQQIAAIIDDKGGGPTEYSRAFGNLGDLALLVFARTASIWFDRSNGPVSILSLALSDSSVFI